MLAIVTVFGALAVGSSSTQDAEDYVDDNELYSTRFARDQPILPPDIASISVPQKKKTAGPTCKPGEKHTKYGCLKKVILFPTAKPVKGRV